MFATLVSRELRSILASPRFLATFLVCALLVMLALVTGAVQVRAFEREQAALAALTDQELAEQTRWFSLRPRALRSADTLAIIATGIHHDVGRSAVIHPNEPLELRHGVFADDPILAVFRDLDLSDILQLVITLYALLLTYDAVSGERESGVLRLVVSHAVPRWRYLAAKLVGNLLGLGVPLLLIALIGWLGLLLAGLPLTGEAAVRFALVLAAGGLLFAVFVTLGVTVSCLTRRPTTSFLVALALWIGMVLVVPRLGLLVASEVVPVPSAAEVDSARAGFERSVLAEAEQALATRWDARRREVSAQPEADRQTYQDDKTWTWLEEDDRARQEALTQIDTQARKLDEQVRNLRQRQEKVALGLAAWTPTAAFRSAALHLATTHVDLLARTSAAMETFREEMRRYLTTKDPSAGAITIQATADSSGARTSIRRGDEGTEALEVSDLPRFAAPAVPLSTRLAAVLPHVAVLLLAGLAAFGTAGVAFARYDAR